MLYDVIMSVCMNISLLIVLAMILTKFQFVKELLFNEEYMDEEREPGQKCVGGKKVKTEIPRHWSIGWNQFLLGLIFAVFCIISDYIGIQVEGAIPNARVIGVLSAGFLGGPIAGMTTAVLAAIHFFADNKRAIDEAKALENGEFHRFLSLINESGNSSFKYLQNVYSPRHYNEQGLSIALAVSEKVLGGRGACRVHGGGFAGTIQAFVPNDILDNYISAMEDIFGKDNCYVLNIRPVGGYALKI